MASTCQYGFFGFFLLSLVKCPYVPGMYPPVLSLKMREPSNNSSHELYDLSCKREIWVLKSTSKSMIYAYAMHVQSRAKLPWPVLLIKYISLRWGVKLWYAPLFVPNWVWSGFDPAFPFSWALPTAATHIFTAATCTTTITTSNLVH